MKNRKILVISLVVLVVGMVLVPVISHQITRHRLAGIEVNWLPNVGTTILTNQEMLAVLDDDTETGFFVYVGMAGCPACQQFEPILDDTLVELGLGLRHFQIEDAMEEDEDVAVAIFEQLDQLGRVRGWEGTVPVIMYFAQGNVLDILSGIQPQEAITRFFERNGGLN